MTTSQNGTRAAGPQTATRAAGAQVAKQAAAVAPKKFDVRDFVDVTSLRQTKPSTGGFADRDRILPGKGLLRIKAAAFGRKRPPKGLVASAGAPNFSVEFEVLFVEPGSVNRVGQTVHYYCEADGNAKDYYAGNVQSVILAIMGRTMEELLAMSDDDYADLLNLLFGEDCTAAGELVWFTAKESIAGAKSKKAGEVQVFPNFYHPTDEQRSQAPN